MSTSTLYKLVFYVPPSSLSACKTAIFAVGAGGYPGGLYSQVCFETRGTQQFLPSATAKPNIGEPGKLEVHEEIRVETLCVGEEVMRNAVRELRRAHPYEQVALEVTQLIDV